MEANLSDALLSAVKGNTGEIKEGDPTTPSPVVDDKVKAAWNAYTDYLDKKGLKGHASLDSGNNGINQLEAYRKENPGTILTKEHIPLIQQALSDYRSKSLALIKSGKATGPDNPDENFMPGLSKVDGIPGSLTTSYQFPAENQTHQLRDSQNRVLSSTTMHIPFAR